MSSCAALAPVLSRLAEGEASPEESLRIARHLPDCTSCRIVLARERRLAGMLEAMADPIAADDGLLRGVMASLPDGPPPAIARIVRRHGLKIAGVAGAVGLACLLGMRVAHVALEGSGLPLLPRMGLEGTAPLLEGLVGVARLVILLLDRVGAAGLLGFAVPGLAALARGSLLLPAAALLAISAFLAIATLSAGKAHASPSALIRSASAVGATPSRAAAAARSPRSDASTRPT